MDYTPIWKKREYDVELSREERVYVEELCHTMTDERIAMELTRIRGDLGIRDSVTKERLLEEIKEDGFDNFVEEMTVPPLFHKLFVPVAEEDSDENR